MKNTNIVRTNVLAPVAESSGQSRRPELRHQAKRVHRRPSLLAIWTTAVLPTLVAVLGAATYLDQSFEKKMNVHFQQQSQWTTAVEKLPDHEIVGMLEMEPFFKDANAKDPNGQDSHGAMARGVAAQKMSSIADHSMFDIVFDDFNRHDGDHDQMSLVILARSLTEQLRDQYDAHRKIVKGKTHECGKKSSFDVFLAEPDCFYDETKLADLKNESRAESLEWELDTVVEKLVRLWTDPTSPQKATRDLEGIAFFNANLRAYKNADFSQSDLDHSGFYGKCNLAGVNWDLNITGSGDVYNHCQADNAGMIAQSTIASTRAIAR